MQYGFPIDIRKEFSTICHASCIFYNGEKITENISFFLKINDY